MFDQDFSKISYPYFKSQAIIETETSTYSSKEEELITENITWNHSLGEVINSLIKNGCNIESFEEYDYSPYDCFNNTIEFEPGKFRSQHLQDMIPMLFSLRASKA